MAALVWLAWLGACVASKASKIDEGPELVSKQLVEEAALEAKFFDFKEKYGVADMRTLEVFFELFDLWIMLYRLNKIEEALSEVLPACRWRQDDFAIKAKQALAFTRWKQGRHREALAHFHDMEGSLGKTAALCENIGHTYNALGMPKEAEHYFNQSLALVAVNINNESLDNLGGSMMGMAGVYEKREQWDKAQRAAKDAYDFYTARDLDRGWTSSLTAKAAMALSKIDLKLGNLEEALKKTEVQLAGTTGTAGTYLPAGLRCLSWFYPCLVVLP